MRKVFLVGIFLLGLFGLPRLCRTEPSVEIFWVEKIQKDGTIIVHTYGRASTKKIKLETVKPWLELAEKSNPLRAFYWSPEPDWQLMFLENGLAKLDGLNSAPKYVAAQEKAKTRGLGIWAKSEAVPGDDSESQGGESPINWEKIKEMIAFWGGLGAVIASLGAILTFLIRLLRRVQVSLIILGPSATGKTWLWTRLVNPDVSQADLGKIKKTQERRMQKSPVPKTMGRFLVTPVFVDVPGGQPSVHLMEILSRRWFSRSKHVWVLTLATTANPTVHRGSSAAEKIDSNFISEQRGYLNLPLAVLSTPRVRKPSMVILVIAKYDIFSDKSWTPNSKDQASELLEKQFEFHITRLREECLRKNIVCVVEYCSALEGWRTDSLLRKIEQSLFLK